MSLALIISIALQTTASQAAPSPDPLPADAIFLYGRARYFSAIVSSRDCRKRLPRPTKALEARFEAVHHSLAERFGARYFDLPPIDSQAVDATRPCDGGTLASFEEKIAAVEHLLDGGK